MKAMFLPYVNQYLSSTQITMLLARTMGTSAISVKKHFENAILMGLIEETEPFKFLIKDTDVKLQ